MAISGHEQEFRDLFAQEAEMRLARLGEQLLALEEAGSDEELIASIFREAHNLKGAAAVVGIDDVSRVAHVLEDLLEQLRSGERLASPELIDALLVSVDGLTEMVPAILAGEDRSATADANGAAAREQPCFGRGRRFGENVCRGAGLPCERRSQTREAFVRPKKDVMPPPPRDG